MEKIKIHPTASVADGAKVGEGTAIWQNCIIMDDSEIGKNCNLGANVFVENDVHIGNGVKIKNNVAIYSGVCCEDDVFLGPNCVFTNVINPRSFINRKTEFRRTIIEKGATIGANATIVCGHKIGKYALIGAGAVVTHDVPAYGLMLGNPARLKGYVCKCGTTLEEQDKAQELTCPQCGNCYKRNKEELETIEEKEV